MNKSEIYERKPHWLKRDLPKSHTYKAIRDLLNKGRIHTVCQEARCPNIWECFSRHTSTFLIMGTRCTRNCRFCAVGHGPLGPPDPEEPVRVAEAAKGMGLEYVVITSVTRDDIPDGGASIFVRTIKEIRKRLADACIEILIPDFQGDTDALKAVLDAHPAILNHNIETVPRLYPLVRSEASYNRSIKLLKFAKQYAPNIPTKSGLMLGLGECCEEVEDTLEDLIRAGCDILTLGQYLQPTGKHLAVERFIPPQEFKNWKNKALKMGFYTVVSGPFVRSSYQAKKLLSRH